MPGTENPASRLHSWLAAVRPHATANPNAGAHVTWCQAWNIPDDDDTEAYRRGLALMNAADETQRLAQMSENLLAAHGLEAFGQIEATVRNFARLPTINIGEFFAGLHDDGLLGLKMLGTLLGEEYPLANIDDDVRDSLLDQVRGVVDSVRADADLSMRDRREILARLRQIEDMLIRASVAGTQDIVRAGDGLMGMLVSLHTRGQAVASHPALHNLLLLVVAIDVALNGGANYAQLAGSPLGETLGLPTGGK